MSASKGVTRDVIVHLLHTVSMYRLVCLRVGCRQSFYRAETGIEEVQGGPKVAGLAALLRLVKQ